MKQEDKFNDEMTKMMQERGGKRDNITYHILSVIIILFVSILKGIDFILTKLRLKNPEPVPVPHYFSVIEIETSKELFKDADESIVQKEADRIAIDCGGIDKFNEKYYVAETWATLAPTTFIQWVTWTLLDLIP